jgi:hypothetical protein
MHAIQIVPDVLPTVAGPAVKCYDITGGANDLLSSDFSIPNDGRGKSISCIVEYTNLGADCAPGYYQPDNRAACTICELDHYCPGGLKRSQCGSAYDATSMQ